MPVVHLTELFIRKAKPAERTIYWDASLPGFGIRIGVLTKVFIVMHGEARKKIALGKYPAVKLQEARQQAAAIIFGPATTAVTNPPTQTESAVQTFIQSHKGKRRTVNEYQRLLSRHFLPHHQSKPLHALQTSDVTAITDSLAGTPAEQIHAHAAMSAFFSWAQGRRLITSNPMRNLPMPARPRSRERTLSDSELAAVYRAALAMGYPFGIIILICIHTGMRRSEAGLLRWEYITADLITLPPEITKNNTRHVLPNLISTHLNRIPKTNGYLFPSSTAATPFTAWSKSKAALDKLSGVSNYVLHDLRRTFSTNHARIGTPPHVTEAILNHKTGVRTPLQRIYDRHSYLPEMRSALTHHDAFLRDILKNE